MTTETMMMRFKSAGLTKKDGTLMVKYCNYTMRANLELLAKGEKTHPMYWTGTARMKTLVTTHYEHLRDILGVLRIEYTMGNDAPRGGMTGEYIQLTAKGRRVMKTTINELLEILK